MLSFFRVIRFAFQDLFRNLSLSFMTVLILVLMLLSVNALVVVRVLTQTAISSIEQQIDLSINFKPGVEEEATTEVQRFLDTIPSVVSVEFKDAEMVLESFRVKHADNEDILSSLDELEENPFGPSMIIRAEDTSKYAGIIEALNVPEYEEVIENKTYADTKVAIDKINSITAQVEQFVLVLSVLFIVIAFLVVFNTIRIMIYTQRTEISIKKLVGATNWFVRGPYIIQALIFSLVSVGITGGLVWAALYFLDPYLAIVFGQAGFLTDYFISHIILFAGTEFAVVLFLTTVTSVLAMRRYLRT